MGWGKLRKPSVSIANVSAEMQIRHLPNVRLERCRYTSLLGKKRWYWGSDHCLKLTVRCTNDSQYAEACVVIQWGTDVPETKYHHWNLCHISEILKQNDPVVPFDKLIVVQLSPNSLPLCNPKFIIIFTETLPYEFTPYLRSLLSVISSFPNIRWATCCPR